MLVWAGLLIVVLYSPIGSPDLYSSSGYSIINQTVSTDKNTILNAPKRNFESDSYSNDAEFPDLGSALKSNYATGSVQSGNVGSQGSSYPIQTQSYQTNNSSSAVNSGLGGSSFLASGGSHGSAASSGISMTTGLSTRYLTTDLNNNSITRQNSIAYTADTGGTDPGGDPTGDPIPVGDGWGILFLFGGIYAFIKVLYKGKWQDSKLKKIQK